MNKPLLHYKDIEHQVIEGHIGTWYGIDELEFEGETFYLLEHEEYGDEAAHLIVNENMKVVIDNSWNSIKLDFIEGIDHRNLDICVICDKVVDIDDESVLYVQDKCYCVDCREEHTRWDEDLNEYVEV